MAVWQFDVYLVPHVEAEPILEAPFAQEPFTWLDEAAREREWWARAQPVPGYAEAFDAVAPRARSWAPDLLQWGAEDGNRIDVWREGGRVSSILVRIDMRASTERFAERVADVALDLGCDYLTPGGYLTEGLPGNLAALMRNSPALRFTEDPIAFLTRVQLGGVEDA